MSNGIDLEQNPPQWFKLRVLTPLHVGTDKAQNWIEGPDFIYQSGKILRGNLQQHLAGLSEREQKRLIDKISNLLLNNNLQNLKNDPDIQAIHANGLSFPFPQACSGPMRDGIFPNIRNGMGQPYVPGSSLKGALSAILVAESKPVKPTDLEARKKFDPKKDALGGIADSIMRFVRVGDVAMSNTTAIVPTKISSLRTDDAGGWLLGWKNTPGQKGSDSSLDPKANRFTIPFEAFSRGVEGCGTLQVLPELRKYLTARGAKVQAHPFVNISSIAKLSKLINDHTQRYLASEIAYFNKYDGISESEKLEQALQSILSCLPEENDATSRCVLQLGRNVGFHSITGDWQASSHIQYTEAELRKGNHRNPMKTRKWALLGDGKPWRFAPFGFVELTWIGEAEGRALQAELLAQVPDAAKLSAGATGGQSQPEPLKPVERPKPTPIKGSPKVNKPIEATIVSQEDNIITFELYIENGNQLVKHTYGQPGDKPLDNTKIYEVLPNNVDGKGQVKSLNKTLKAKTKN